MKKFVFRIGEYFGLLASLIFAYELIAADRHFPILDLSNPVIEAASFLQENDREIVFVKFSSTAFKLDNIYPENDEFLIELERGKYLQFAWTVIKKQPLIQANEERAEDETFYFKGPVFIAIEEAEGDKYISLLPAPFTDTTASQTKCSETLFDANSFQFVTRYIFQCMLSY